MQEEGGFQPSAESGEESGVVLASQAEELKEDFRAAEHRFAEVVVYRLLVAEEPVFAQVTVLPHSNYIAAFEAFTAVLVHQTAAADGCAIDGLGEINVDVPGMVSRTGRKHDIVCPSGLVKKYTVTLHYCAADHLAPRHNKRITDTVRCVFVRWIKLL